MPFLEVLTQDVRYGARTIRHKPGFAVVTILTLTLGIGAPVTIFTIGNALLFRAAPGVAEPGQLIEIAQIQPGGVGVELSSYPDYVDIRERVTRLEDVYAYQLDLTPLSLKVDASAERVFGSVVSVNYFDALGVTPAAGRLFGRADSERSGASPVVVLSHRFWTRRFNADPTLVGRSLQLNGHPFTVVGVANKAFLGMSVVAADVWMPTSMIGVARPSVDENWLTTRQAPWLMLGARRRPGVTIKEAGAELEAIGHTLAREHSRDPRGARFGAASSSPIPAGLRSIAAGFLALLLGIVAIVLVIVCTNVAGVLLARSTTRRREMAVRTAVGAGRVRLIQQLLTETMLLFLAGAAGGLLLARALTLLVPRLLPTFPLPVDISLPLDARVIAFALLLSLVTSLLSGLAPALDASRTDVVSALKDESHAAPARLRLRNAFVVGQIAFSVLLVVCAGLLVRAVGRVTTVDKGFDPAGVETVSLDLSLAGYTDRNGPAFTRDLLERIRSVPGIQSATLADRVPGGPLRTASVRDRGPNGPGPAPSMPQAPVSWNLIEPDYFATLRIPFVAGRDFTGDDREGAQPVAIVSEATANRVWPGRAAVGNYFTPSAGPGAGRAAPLLVVGVVRDLKGEPRLRDGSILVVYVPLSQRYTPQFTILARTTRGQRIAAEMRSLVSTMNANLPVLSAQTLEEQETGPVMAQLRIAASISASVGLMALLLASMGIYGVTAYTVGHRTREIGIRLALGAERGDIARMVFRQGFSLVSVGAVVGIVLALAASRLFVRLLFGMSPLDLLTFGGVVFLFALVAAAACYVPARRAMRITAMQALRYE
jgi:putative ABC transport system permease protein